MKPQAAPRLEKRRAADFERELVNRARAWIPSWSVDDTQADLGLALLKVAARFSSEVAERLDVAGNKMALGFLDWLGLAPNAARPARLPVVLKMADTATESILAPRPIKMQVDVGDATVTFETETDLRVIPGQLAAVVAADPDADAYYLPPSGLTSLEPLQPLPSVWRLKNFVAANSATLQLDPGLGLAEGMLIAIGADQYRVVKAQDDLVTIDPPIPSGDGLVEGTGVSKVDTFDPFNGARNLQEHVVYIGDTDVLNVEAAARIEVSGLETAPTAATWEYWGKGGGDTPADTEVRWRSIDLEPSTVGASPAPPLVLDKPKGSLETTQIGSVNSRWIRVKVGKSTEQVVSDGVTLRINPRPDPSQPPEALTDPALESELPPLEIIVNTTPSATTNFYLLGREPRLLDTVYFGSAEAFSKPKATAWIRFDLSDGLFGSVAAFDGWIFGQVLAGVDKAGALHLFSIGPNGELTRIAGGNPLQPTVSGNDSSDKGIQLTSSPFKPAMWAQQFDLHVAVAAKSEAWVWTEGLPIFSPSGWKSWGSPNPADLNASIDGLAVIHDGGPALVALVNGQLFKGKLPSASANSATWTEFDPAFGAGETVVRIVGVRAEAFGVIPSSLLVVTEHSATSKCTLYEVAADATSTSFPVDLVKDVAPFGVQRTSGSLEVVVVEDAVPPNLWASATAAATTSLDQLLIQETAIDGHIEGGVLVAYCVASKAAGDPVLVSWLPFDPSLNSLLFQESLVPTPGDPNGPVAVSTARVYLPGRRGGEIFAGSIGARRRFVASASTFRSVAAFDLPGPSVGVGDSIAVGTGAARAGAKIAAVSPTSSTNEVLFWLDTEIAHDNLQDEISIYGTSSPGTAGTVRNSTTIQVSAGLANHALLFVSKGPGLGSDLVEITHFDATGTIATVEPAVSVAPGPCEYWSPSAKKPGHIYPALNFDGSNNGWDIDLVKSGEILFPSMTPQRQPVIAYVASNATPALPEWVALGNAWNPFGGGPADFLVDPFVSGWRSALADTSINPALAWEYWNGTGWWRLRLDEDETTNFRSSGIVRFTIPDDLRSTEWAGKTNYWIRARLIGGDYGKETVVVETQDKGGGKTEQTVNRTTEGIQPPYALSVRAAYAVDEAVAPAFVLTQDSGALRDQSDANRTPGAMIETFTPLSLTLARFDAPPASQGDADDCAPDCACADGEPSSSPKAGSGQATSDGKTVSPSIGPRRALYLGFTSKLLGEPVQVLFVVGTEGFYDAIAPLKIDALIGERFTPIVADDHTRALGESGLLQMVFNVAPLQAELFGQPLSWLRVAPNADSADWNPSIAGIYLNGVWCQSAETMTRELLGSSGGQPGLTVTVARPPLLQDSLQLRVREALGEEERTALLDADPDSVIYDLPDLPGDWVLWNKVAEPTDWGPNDRVYGLDESSGTVTFGDGLHGMIPPAGTDCIVAFSYRRTDPTSDGVVAANLVTARSELNLVTPVDSVESVVAADQSAGGLAPESPERVLEFAPAKLRNRGRAVSLQDFEDLALENGDKVVQARCFARNGRARLVVVMRGLDPMPTKAQQRELRQMLLDIAPVTFGAPGALTINGPNVRKLRVALQLGVENLDDAGTVAKQVKQRLVDRFNSELDGNPGHGWTLGRAPRPEDLAEALLDIQNLESIISIDLVELNGKAGAASSLAKVAPADLITLAADDILIGFDILEAAA